ncbi:MAG: hypothetical protein LWX70_13305 [Sphingobacteriia bacterium]|nr:hypothetical protein [Sphingobacteriia bacterium]
MNDKEKHGTIGVIIKRETLALYESPVKFNVLILESQHPFPGYYCADYSDNQKPQFLFFVLKPSADYDEDNVIRATRKVKSLIHADFDAAPGMLTLFNHNYPCIRVDMWKPEDLLKIIAGYEKEGIMFVKHQDVRPFDTIIRVKKFIEMEYLADDIWRDCRHFEMNYLFVPVDLTWEIFEEATRVVKNNFHDTSFDAGKGFVYEKIGLQDYIRIFSNRITADELVKIRELYLREIQTLSD